MKIELVFGSSGDLWAVFIDGVRLLAQIEKVGESSYRFSENGNVDPRLISLTLSNDEVPMATRMSAVAVFAKDGHEFSQTFDTVNSTFAGTNSIKTRLSSGFDFYMQQGSHYALLKTRQTEPQSMKEQFDGLLERITEKLTIEADRKPFFDNGEYFITSSEPRKTHKIEVRQVTVGDQWFVAVDGILMLPDFDLIIKNIERLTFPFRY